MIELIGKYIGYKILSNGNFEISFEADRTQTQKIIRNKFADTALDLSVKKHREKRSLDANRYFWAMCGKLAAKLKKPNNEVYKDYIRDYGCYKPVQINNEAVDTIATVWRNRGLGWLVEKVDEDGGFTLLNMYYGSSVFSTKQMSRLIDGLVQDCKLQGIETLTPEQLGEMIDSWKPEKLKKGSC